MRKIEVVNAVMLQLSNNSKAVRNIVNKKYDRLSTIYNGQDLVYAILEELQLS